LLPLTKLKNFASAARFCWFQCQVDTLDYMEQNSEHLTSVLYAIYRATDLRFMGEHEMDEAQSFSMKLLEKSVALKSRADDFVVFPSLHKVVNPSSYCNPNE
jgi:geranyllinalool synthase